MAEDAKRTIARRVHHSPEAWARARWDYLAGATASAVSAHYGMSVDAIRKRASKEGWCKAHHLADTPLPAPLHPFPDAAQAEEIGPGEFRSLWFDIAHDAQKAPDALASGAAWSTWLFQGGRGAGKTRAGAEWLAMRAEAKRGAFALVGPTQHDVREVMIDGPSGLRFLPGRARPEYEKSRRRLIWPNGSVAYTFSAEEPERLRGPQFEAAWADEFCIWPKPALTLSNLRLGLRLGDAPQLVVTTTPKPIAALRSLRAESTCVLTQVGTVANAKNLTASFLDDVNAIYGGTRLAEQELEGRLLDGDGALWSVEMLKAAAGVAPARGCERVVVGVDPPASAGGAACGIVVAGRVGRQHFVLADRSALGLSPLGWAQRACEAAAEFGAAEIVAEANQGGEMVRAVLAQAGAPCAVRLVHASRGKRARAEPVAAMYEQGRVTHCGAFAALEEELLALGVSETEGLLDRADALVWALTALMSGGEGPRVRSFDFDLRRSGLSG